MRFISIENNTEFPNDGKTCWYWDTERSLVDENQPFIAIQCYCDRDPNDFIRHDAMAVLYTDQAEYYAVCLDCYQAYRHMQWSGSTKSPGWEEHSQRYVDKHRREKGWCEFCDPIFGNGGWV